MPDNAADRKDIRRREKAAKIAAAQRAAVLREIMSGSAGRAWLWDILASCSCFSTTFNGDALQSAYNEGRRSVGLAILADIIATCPDQYIQAMKESNERSATDERRSSTDSSGGDSGSEPTDDQGFDPYAQEPEPNYRDPRADRDPVLDYNL